MSATTLTPAFILSNNELKIKDEEKNLITNLVTK